VEHDIIREHEAESFAAGFAAKIAEHDHDTTEDG
jgi:hypothetical protein